MPQSIRRAVVVIARGADAHGHFPAAVAGQIYRDLNGRFGTPTNLQLAAKRDSTSLGGDAGRRNMLNEEDVDETGAGTLEPVQAGLSSTMKVFTNSTSSPTPNRGKANVPANGVVKSKAKLVLMPIPKRTKRP